MNHTERRKMRRDAAKALSKAKGYVLVVQNDQGAPVYFGDVKMLDNKNDVRHVYMHTILEDVVNGAKALQDHAIRRKHEMEQSDMVTKAKEERSKELSQFSGGEQ